MIDEQLKALKDYWSKINDIEELPADLEEEISLFINDELELPDIAFKRTTPSFERITVNNRISKLGNSRITEIGYLKNPPPDCIKNYGRANLIGQSVFYGTFMRPIAIKEMRPNKKERYTVSKWVASDENNQIVVFPIFKPINDTKLYRALDIFEETREDELTVQLEDMLNDLEEEQVNKIKELLAFIAQCFAQEAPPNNLTYFFTAHLANKIFTSVHSGNVEAITYPSVQDVTKIENIALKPEVVEIKYGLIEVSDYLVTTSNHDANQYLSNCLGRTNQISDGAITWV